MMSVLFTAILFLNPWIWRLLELNPLVALFLVFVSFGLYFTIFGKKNRVFKLLIAGFVLLFIFQWQASEPKSLISLSNDEQRLQQMRLREYPPVFIKFGEKTLWIPIAHWFEGRKESIAFFRILKNFSEVIDPSLYFFANHPRERIGYNEFEKLPYILLPFFVVGALSLIEQKRVEIVLISTVPFLLLLSFIGDSSELGPFSLFPFLIVSSVEGLRFFFDKLSKKKVWKKWTIVGSILLIYLIVLVQVISFTRY